MRNFERLLISREMSRKTEAVFLVGSRRSGGKSKSLRARFLLPAFSFGEAKENAEPQLQISNTGSYIVKFIVDHKTVQICKNLLCSNQPRRFTPTPVL